MKIALAKATLKDPYIFDFLGLGQEAHERTIEDDFYIDLLFYHLKLQCYVVVELKTTDFKPEYAGQLNFYLTAVDAQFKTVQDQPTIGLLLCKTKNRVVAEYALRNVAAPIGIAEYQLIEALPKEFKSNLPTIEQIEAEFRRPNNNR